MFSVVFEFDSYAQLLVLIVVDASKPARDSLWGKLPLLYRLLILMKNLEGAKETKEMYLQVLEYHIDLAFAIR